MMKKKKILILSLILFIIVGCFKKQKADNIFDHAVDLWNKGQYVKALEAFEKFIDLYPKHHSAPEANLWIADIRYLYLNDYAQALYDYRRVINNYPKSEYAPIAQFKISKMLFEVLSEEYQSITEYQAFLKLFPNHHLAHKAQYNIAEIHSFLEDFKQAITEFELFLKRYPDSDMKLFVFQRLGELYCLEKMYSQSIEYLNKALDLSKDENNKNRIKKIMADCFARQGDLAKGLKIYEEMLDNDTENDILKDRIESLRTQLKISNSDQMYNW